MTEAAKIGRPAILLKPALQPEGTMEKAYRLPDYIINAIGNRWPFSETAIRLQVAIDRLTAFRKAPVQEYVANDGSRVWVDRRGYVYGSDV
jgi:hypothetical protein